LPGFPAPAPSPSSLGKRLRVDCCLLDRRWFFLVTLLLGATRGSQSIGVAAQPSPEGDGTRRNLPGPDTERETEGRAPKFETLEGDLDSRSRTESDSSDSESDTGRDTVDDDAFISASSILISSSMLSIFVVGYLINTHRLRHIPESGAAVILGFVTGCAVRTLGLTQEEHLLNFNEDFFFYILLSAIISEAGFSLDTAIFVDNLSRILAFAILGTVISTLLVGEGLALIARTGLIGLEVQVNSEFRKQCFMFGSLISATDPGATLALFSSEGKIGYRTDTT
jgi:hypothetical protein